MYGFDNPKNTYMKTSADPNEKHESWSCVSQMKVNISRILEVVLIDFLK